jgi:hypothetical protein
VRSLKFILRLSSLLLTVGTGLRAAATPITLPVVQYSQDGRHFTTVSLLQTTVSPARYYRYRASTGHPAFGTTSDTATIAMVWDSTDNTLGLMFISGGNATPEGGADITLSGMPRVARMTVADDATEFHYSPRRGKLTGSFHYAASTDGFVLGGLQSSSFRAALSLSNRENIDEVRLANGDPTAGGSFVAMNLKKPIYFRVQAAVGASVPNPGVGSSVPEPISMVPLALLIWPLVSRRRAA